MAEHRFTCSVELGVGTTPVFELIADPRRRAQWQASLRRVEMITPGPPGVGTQWWDVTVIGARPRMEIVTWQTGRRWAERGVWQGVQVVAELDFSPIELGCRVAVTAEISTTGVWWPVGWAAARFGPQGIAADLRRAAQILAPTPR